MSLMGLSIMTDLSDILDFCGALTYAFSCDIWLVTHAQLVIYASGQCAKSVLMSVQSRYARHKPRCHDTCFSGHSQSRTDLSDIFAGCVSTAFICNIWLVHVIFGTPVSYYTYEWPTGRTRTFVSLMGQS